jgi:hypothetical protein
VQDKERGKGKGERGKGKGERGKGKGESGEHTLRNHALTHEK